jgi:hypothetical protein
MLGMPDGSGPVETLAETGPGIQYAAADPNELERLRAAR